MYELHYSETADWDIESIFNYIAEDDVNTAVSFINGMENRILHLRDFPELGHRSKYPELFMQGIRILTFDSYLIFYTIDKPSNVINILRVLHGARNYRNLF